VVNPHDKARFSRSPSLCGVCGMVLNPVLVTAGYARHPCCDPDEQPWDWRNGTLSASPRPMPPLHRDREQVFRRPSELAKERGMGAHAPADIEPTPVRPVENLPTQGLF
jgi:hypothetical protein